MRAAAPALAAFLCACAGEVSGVGSDGGPGGGDGGGGGADAAPPVDESAELYDLAAFPRFEIELPPESVTALENDPATYAPGTFRYGDEVVENIGVRLKGEYTFRPLSQKASFKLKFDEFVPDQSFRGLKRMTLNNGFEDPSFVAERLVYLAFRNADLPAPRVNSAEVTVNGQLYGVYVNIETEDKTFLRRWFASDEGNVYEEQGVDWYPGNEEGFELETNEEVNDRSDLTALFAAVDGAADETLLADVGAIVDTERFLRYCALEGIVNQWDGYAYTQFGPNNYRMYHDPSTGRFSLLPWGMDMAMKPLGDADYVDLHSAAGLLLRRCLEVESCRTAYDAVVAEETDRFEALALDQVAEAAYAQIRERVYADPRKEHSNEAFDSTYAGVLQFTRQRPASVRAQLP
ncbi:MAG TPA: CotH kinase family protein [Kofleriaceae bacterium]|nr:CotH kinase family protein [Kofleriaceae bacterium]